MPPMDLVIGTGNPHKLAEIKAVLDGDLVRVLGVRDVIEVFEEPEETGETFEENARLKASYYARLTGRLCLADDSGLEVDALNGEPGVYSSRYAGSDGDDAANNEKLLRELSDVADDNRGAQFQCVMALATPDTVHFVASGICRGRILNEAQGDAGFGYDPLFFHEPSEKTFAELPRETKSKFSHRGEALKVVADQLSSLVSILRNRIDH